MPSPLGNPVSATNRIETSEEATALKNICKIAQNILYSNRYFVMYLYKCNLNILKISKSFEGPMDRSGPQPIMAGFALRKILGPPDQILDPLLGPHMYVHIYIF